MKKVKMILGIIVFSLLNLVLISCDGNFGVKNLESTCVILEKKSEEKIEVFCKSEKINVSYAKLEELDKSYHEYFKKQILDQFTDDTEKTYDYYYINSSSIIEDRNNIEIYFCTIYQNEKYTHNLFIKSFKDDEDGGPIHLNIIPFELESESGKKIKAYFTYTFYRSI